jgi:hypothetical protein
VSVEYLIICDLCGSVLAASQQNAAIARLEVARCGGLVAQPGGLDYCLVCRKEETPHDLTSEEAEQHELPPPPRRPVKRMVRRR